MLKKILTLSKKFISIKSTSENHEALDRILEVATSELKGYKVEEFVKAGIKSILVYNGNKRPKKFRVLLNGHLDVIPGKENQFFPYIQGNKLYGVGSMDMKANTACLITVFKSVAKKVAYPLALQLVTDEEIGGFNGTKHQIDKGVRTEFVIAGETTNFNIAYKAKGIIWLKITSKGESAHGAYPWRGENSILKMNSFLNHLYKRFPSPNKERWVTTINLSKIETSNSAFNKIPDDCTVWLDIRYVPEENKTILKNIKKLLPRGFKLNVILKEPSMFVDKRDRFLKKLQTVTEDQTNKKVLLYGAQGSSDARHFTNINCPGIEFGPIGGGGGTDAEWVNIKSLTNYCNILTRFLLSLN